MNEQLETGHSVLICSESKDRVEVIKKIIEGVAENIVFQVANTFEKTNDLLKSKSDFKLIVVDNIAEIISNPSPLKSLKSFTILLHDPSNSSSTQDCKNIYVSQKRLFSDFVEHLKKIFEITNPVRLENALSVNSQVYLPVNSQKLMNLRVLPCEIFVSLGKSNKFAKVGNSNTQFEQSSVPLYIDKGISEFFLKSDDYYRFEKLFLSESDLTEKLKVNKSKNEMALELVRETVVDLGFSEVLISQVESVIEDVYDLLSKKEYKELLTNLDLSIGSYLYNHSYLSSLLSSSFLKTQSWNSVDLQKKVVMGNMLHDLGFEVKENAYYETLPEEKRLDLPRSVQKDIANHTSVILNLLSKDKNVSEDVLRIIETIHMNRKKAETANVTYFNKIAVVVNLSHELAVRLFRIAFNPKKISTVLENLKEDYSFGPYKKMINDYVVNAKSVLKAV